MVISEKKFQSVAVLSLSFVMIQLLLLFIYRSATQHTGLWSCSKTKEITVK